MDKIFWALIVLALVAVIPWIGITSDNVIETTLAHEYCVEQGYDYWSQRMGEWDDTCVKTDNGNIEIAPLYVERELGWPLFVKIFTGQKRGFEIRKITKIN